ncbi:S-methyl-5-thioribose-1-phosphate isomerase [Clostridium sp. OS1-26]|uniref:S-methyl-5-thioribose-1-phosphate isomerase n=1 Tax=Clostridium sp. OS1-26 TaxID=3070681 RepID=UPI0027DF270E|nr:S-methyl-5-thioribose-1-phosphate isomerase [Clostridium sp. OS1-26]WML33100.1 S-methyl-5-thioribose-1-phosphate isomerase [Clostridium sp. OS1-26]
MLENGQLNSTIIQSVVLDDDSNALIVLDQTLLPNEKIFLRLTSQNQIWEAIYSLRVRGAPAIGIAAGYGAYLGTKESQAESYDELYEDFKKVKEYLASSRPTAVNLFWALDRMENRFKREKGKSVQEVKRALKEESENIRAEDEVVCKNIGENALSLLKSGMGILTHCNAGTVATAKYGTALAPIYLGKERGYDFKVYADETRPLLQGARLTTWELKEAGIDVTLICDNMASIVMKEEKIQAVLVGCDRVAENGDTANKIGTSGVAILAKHYGIPFYVCAPLSTIDLKCSTGEDIHIELRADEEITSKWYERPMAPAGVKAYNPCFDVTDNSLITAIVTENGIAYPPYSESLPILFK